MTTFLDRALQAAATARRDRDAGDFNSACNRAYYAMFYAVHGMLEAEGEDAVGKTHATALRLFSQKLVSTGKAPPDLARALAVAQNLRSRADYSVEGATAGDADDAIDAMDKLVAFAEPRLKQPKETAMSIHAIDHIGLSVSDYARARAFYLAALAPLGWDVVMEFPTPGGKACGLGKDGKPFLWISEEGKTVPHTHIALGAESRKAVDDFYAAAIKAGGKDNGAPGIRAHYHPTYYGAFVLDPDGHNIEAVCHKAE